MILGCCAEIKEAHVLYEAGFDFIECTVVSLIPEKNDVEFAKVLKQYQSSPLPVEACNIFLPGDLKIVGEEVDEERIKSYIEVAFSRVKQIGADTVVFGSGGARSLPDHFSKEKGKEQIINFLNIATHFAASLGITIVIEPLNQNESNIINTIPEAVEFVKIINHTSIQVLADFYHMDEENEPLENIVSNKNYLKHVHVADTGRMAPGTGSYPYKDFVVCIKQANYEGRMSIECKWRDFENEIVQAREFLKEIFNA